jgi:hypothetical protein
MGYDHFLPLVEYVWNNSLFYQDAAKRIRAKFKIMRASLKKLAEGHHNLRSTITDVNHVTGLLDTAENSRDIIPR